MPRVSPAVAALTRDLERAGRPIRRHELIARHCERTLSRALAHGGVVLMAPGIYAGREASARFVVRMRAIGLWAGGKVVTGGQAALCAVGVDVPTPGTILVLAAPTFAARAIPGTRVVRTTALVVQRSTPWGTVCSQPDAVAQVWFERPPTARVGATLDALRGTALSAEAVLAAAERWPRMPDRAGLRTLLDLYASGVTSYLEYQGRTTVFTGPAFAQWGWQVSVTVAGRRFVLDLFHEPSRTAIELDGAAWHGGDRARRHDIERDALLASSGIVTLRFTYEDVTRRPEWCRARALAAVASRTAR